MQTTLEAALDAASRGWPTFRLGYKQKIPLPGSKGFHDATTDEVTLREWFTDTRFNIGLATGGRSGLLVLDVDGDKEGYKSISDLQEQHGVLPGTMSVYTGKGIHYYFGMPAHVDIHPSAGKVGAGLDIRGTGGYVVYPPSLHPNGNYYVWNGEIETIADTPSWLIELTSSKIPNFHTTTTPAGNYIPQGQRNVAAISIAGFFRRYGFEYEQIAAQLRVLPFENPMTEEEIRVIAGSATRYEKESTFSDRSYTYDVMNLEKEL